MAGANAALARIKPGDGSTLPIGELMERIIAVGDLSRLDAGDRAHYLVRVAESAGLNPLSQPFDLIPGQGGKLVLYANKKATDQLRKIYGLTSRIVSRENVEGVYVVEVEVSDGVRTETNIGAVPIKGLQGEALANALMKAFTKAKRRATLDYAGLGVLDESEVEGMRAAMREEPAPPRVKVLTEAESEANDQRIKEAFNAIGKSNAVEVVSRETGEIAPPARRTVAGRIRELFAELEWSDDSQMAFLEQHFGVSTIGKLQPEDGKQAIHGLERLLAVKMDEGDEEDEAIDAEFAPVPMDGMPAADQWTER